MPQSLSKIYIHLIFSTKGRERCIKSDRKKDVFSYIAGIINQQDCSVITVGGDADHIHALFCLSRTKTISDIVREIKSSSTIWYKQTYNENFGWQGGYGVFSVSQSKVDTVKNYIANQEEHHKHKTFQEEYREFLESYGVKYDERYVWD